MLGRNYSLLSSLKKMQRSAELVLGSSFEGRCQAEGDDGLAAGSRAFFKFA